MERQDCNAPARLQCARQLFHELIKHFKLVVDVNAQRLKRPLAGLFDRLLLFLFRQKIQRLFDHPAQLCRRVNPVAAADFFCDCLRKLLAIWLVRIFIQHTGKLFSRYRIQPFCRADALFLIQSQIQRTIHFEGKTALRIVDLHRRHSQVRQDEIKSADLLRDLVDRAEILQPDGKNILPIAQLLQTLFRLGGFLRVYVRRIHVPLTMQTFQHRFCVSAVAQRRVKAGFPGLNLQKIQNFLYHNRNVHPGRRISLTDHMLHCILIFFRLQLLIFFLEFLRVFSFISNAALMLLRLIFLFQMHPPIPC